MEFCIEPINNFGVKVLSKMAFNKGMRKGKESGPRDEQMRFRSSAICSSLKCNIQCFLDSV